MSSVKDEVSRTSSRIGDEFGRADDKFEDITGLSIGEGLLAAGTLGGSLLPGAISSLSGSSAASSLGLSGNTSIESLASGVSSGKIDPVKLAAAYGYTQKDDIEAFLKDPTGAIARAEKAAARIAELQKTSAGRAILQQEQQLEKIEGLTQPFRDVATNTAIPQLSALALGGETDYQQSDLLGRQLESGREGILKNRAAGPGIKSSGTFKNLADLSSKLSAEDVGRFEQGNLDLLNTGLRGEDILRSAETTAAGAGGQVFSNLGANINASQQNVANAQLANAQTLGSGISSLASLSLLRRD